jgi:23S rRNA pseudouridine1911/1915/1917 synthase
MRSMPSVIKISSPETKGFWEMPVLFEDEWLLALDKPAELHTSEASGLSGHPSLLSLLHSAIQAAKPWVVERSLRFLAGTHRPDHGTSGVVLLAKDRETAAFVANEFGTEKPHKRYLALARGIPKEDRFTVDARLAPDPLKPGRMRIDSRHGKKSRTQFEVLERFNRWALVACLALTDRPHQISLHLRRAGLSLAADQDYQGASLLLSSIKPGFRLKPNKTERPLMTRPALHLETISIIHPVTGVDLQITAPLPKDFSVALKYLRKYSAGNQALPP